jgi:hypothetical protein
VYSRDLVGKITLKIALGRVMHQLTSDANGLADARKGFFEMQDAKGNHSQIQLRRCGSMRVTSPCSDEPGVGALCVNCVDPDPWRDFCDSTP